MMVPRSAKQEPEADDYTADVEHWHLADSFVVQESEQWHRLPTIWPT